MMLILSKALICRITRRSRYTQPEKNGGRSLSEKEKKVAAGTVGNDGVSEEKEKAVLEKYDRESKTRTFVNPTMALVFKVF